jgi:DNA invertase Pin-like site-specific DNA recombinase
LPSLKRVRRRASIYSYTSRGSTPQQRQAKTTFQMWGVFAEFERGIIRERVNAGLARARDKGVRLGRRLVVLAQANR